MRTGAGPKRNFLRLSKRVDDKYQKPAGSGFLTWVQEPNERA